MFKARDVMGKNVVTVTPDDTIDHAISLILEHRISGLPVVDDAGCLNGIISEFDLLEVICDCETKKDRVRNYMSTGVLTADENLDLASLVDIFRSNPVRRIPLVRDGKLVGIVTRHDLMRFIQHARSHVKRAIATKSA